MAQECCNARLDPVPLALAQLLEKIGREEPARTMPLGADAGCLVGWLAHGGIGCIRISYKLFCLLATANFARCFFGLLLLWAGTR